MKGLHLYCIWDVGLRDFPACLRLPVPLQPATQLGQRLSTKQSWLLSREVCNSYVAAVVSNIVLSCLEQTVSDRVEAHVPNWRLCNMSSLLSTVEVTCHAPRLSCSPREDHLCSNAPTRPRLGLQALERKMAWCYWGVPG